MVAVENVPSVKVAVNMVNLLWKQNRDRGLLIDTYGFIAYSPRQVANMWKAAMFSYLDSVLVGKASGKPVRQGGYLFTVGCGIHEGGSEELLDRIATRFTYRAFPDNWCFTALVYFSSDSDRNFLDVYIPDSISLLGFWLVHPVTQDRKLWTLSDGFIYHTVQIWEEICSEVGCVPAGSNLLTEVGKALLAGAKSSPEEGPGDEEDVEDINEGIVREVLELLTNPQHTIRG